MTSQFIKKKLTKVCPKCGGPKTIPAKRCRKCFTSKSSRAGYSLSSTQKYSKRKKGKK